MAATQAIKQEPTEVQEQLTNVKMLDEDKLVLHGDETMETNPISEVEKSKVDPPSITSDPANDFDNVAHPNQQVCKKKKRKIAQQCSICQKEFVELQRHKRLVHGLTREQSRIPDFSLDQATPEPNQQIYEKRRRKLPKNCSICQKEFVELQRHKRLVHGLSREQSLTPDFTPSKEQLQQMNAFLPKSCPICRKKVKNLPRHKRLAHSMSREESLDLNDTSSSEGAASELRATLTSGGRVLQTCSVCEMDYVELARHKRRVHGMTMEESLNPNYTPSKEEIKGMVSRRLTPPCPICHKIVTGLPRHKRLVHGMSRKQSLETQTVDLDETKHQIVACPLCKKYVYSQKLPRHKEKFHGIPRKKSKSKNGTWRKRGHRPCPFCPKWVVNINQHTREMHGSQLCENDSQICENGSLICENGSLICENGSQMSENGSQMSENSSQGKPRWATDTRNRKLPVARVLDMPQPQRTAHNLAKSGKRTNKTAIPRGQDNLGESLGNSCPLCGTKAVELRNHLIHRHKLTDIQIAFWRSKARAETLALSALAQREEMTRSQQVDVKEEAGVGSVREPLANSVQDHCREEPAVTDDVKTDPTEVMACQGDIWRCQRNNTSTCRDDVGMCVNDVKMYQNDIRMCQDNDRACQVDDNTCQSAVKTCPDCKMRHEDFTEPPGVSTSQEGPSEYQLKSCYTPLLHEKELCLLGFSGWLMQEPAYLCSQEEATLSALNVEAVMYAINPRFVLNNDLPTIHVDTVRCFVDRRWDRDPAVTRDHLLSLCQFVEYVSTLDRGYLGNKDKFEIGSYLYEVIKELEIKTNYGSGYMQTGQ